MSSSLLRTVVFSSLVLSLGAPVQASLLKSDEVLIASLRGLAAQRRVRRSGTRRRAKGRIPVAKLAGFLRGQQYAKALKTFSKNAGSKLSSTERSFRAGLLDKLGFYHVALNDRIRAAYRKPSKKLLSKIGESALVLGRFGSLAALARKLRRAGRSSKRWPASFRMALAAHALRSGSLKKAAQWLPRKSQLLRMRSGMARYKALLLAGNILYGLNKFKQALSVVSVNFSRLRGFDMGSIRLLRARILFDLRRYGSALDELLYLPKTSPSWHPGVVVGAWAAYHVEDHNLALGQLMNLNTPFLESKFRPETYLLEAATLYRLCYYPSAARSLGKLRKKYGKFSRVIDRARRRYSGSQLFTMARSYAQGERKTPSGFKAAEWQLLVDGFLSQPLFAELDRSWIQVQNEQKALSKHFRDLSTLRFQANATAEAALNEYRRVGGKIVKSRLAGMKVATKEVLEGALAVDVEINTALRERLIQAKAPQRKEVDFEKDLHKGFEFWPFEGEFWRDETGGYTFATSHVCAEGERR